MRSKLCNVIDGSIAQSSEWLELGQADPVVIRILLSPYARAIAFVWGILWGSFSNVLIYRVPRGMSPVRPRSRCGGCDAPVAWYDNIPLLSYIILGGRCRRCKTKFGLRYLLVELIAGVLSVVAYIHTVVQPGLLGAALGWDALIAWLLWFVFALVLVVITFIDLDFWIIPPSIVMPVALFGIASTFVDASWLGITWQQAGLGALLGAGLVIVVRAIYLKLRGLEGIGLGDAYLLFFIGAFMGPAGVAWAVTAGAIQGMLVAIPLKLLGRQIANRDVHEVHGDDPELGPPQSEVDVMRTLVPFGPFLALAALEAFALPEIVGPYFRWLSGG